jgi:hypothetical protein
MGDHPVDVVARSVHHVLPQQVVDAVVEELLLRGDDVAEGHLVAHAQILLHLGVDGEHALGKPSVTARHVGFLQQQRGRAQLSRLHCGRHARGARAHHDDIHIHSLSRVVGTRRRARITQRFAAASRRATGHHTRSSYRSGSQTRPLQKAAAGQPLLVRNTHDFPPYLMSMFIDIWVLALGCTVR